MHVALEAPEAPVTVLALERNMPFGDLSDNVYICGRGGEEWESEYEN
jgi:hypothetical protein